MSRQGGRWAARTEFAHASDMEIAQAIDAFVDDPADSRYQREYLAGLKVMLNVRRVEIAEVITFVETTIAAGGSEYAGPLIDAISEHFSVRRNEAISLYFNAKKEHHSGCCIK